MFDNGTEFISWDFLERIQIYYGKDSYFAHPNSPQNAGLMSRKISLLGIMLVIKATTT